MRLVACFIGIVCISWCADDAHTVRVIAVSITASVAVISVIKPFWNKYVW